MRYFSKIIKKFKPGQIIVSENSECDGMYIIESGRVRVYKSAGAEQGSTEIELCTMGPKAMFGEMSMLDNGKRSANVQAIELTVCTVITRRMFEYQLERIPPWMVNMIRILVVRLRETNDRLRSIIEESSVPPDDTGSMIMVNEEELSETTPAFKQSSENKQYKDDIIKQLFSELGEESSEEETHR